jgi:geranylgeranyl pyrophosphate synthase
MDETAVFGPGGDGRCKPQPLTYEHALDRWGAPLESRILASVSSSGLVAEMVQYHLRSGGKRMRALLPVWLCHNLGGDAEGALELGAGLELLHNATLVHDDLQDGDTCRRGAPTVWARWGPAQAINAGNALICQAFERLARAPLASHATAVASHALWRVVEGQAMEFQLQEAEGENALPPAMQIWEGMASRKTGALFGACLRLGAMAAGVTRETEDSCAAYGEALGLLFQVQDDHLDLVGNKGRGRVGSDLMEGKRSFPVVWAVENAAPAQLASLRALLEKPRDRRTWIEVDEALAILRACGALDATARWLRISAEAALQHPVCALLPGWTARVLAPVAHTLVAQPAAAARARRAQAGIAVTTIRPPRGSARQARQRSRR